MNGNCAYFSEIQNLIVFVFLLVDQISLEPWNKIAMQNIFLHHLHRQTPAYSQLNPITRGNASTWGQIQVRKAAEVNI